MTLIIASCVVILFLLVVFRGAPYVPTHRKTLETALDLMDLQEGDLVVDLGSGDGAFLKAAASRGLRAAGYEINPLLCFISWLRCWRFRRHVKVYFADYWLAQLPPDTRAVYVFLAGPFMKRLAKKLQQEIGRRGKGEELIVVSYGFAIPGFLPKKIKEGLYLYQIN